MNQSKDQPKNQPKNQNELAPHKIRLGHIAASVGKRLLSPRHAVNAIQLQRKRKIIQRSSRDIELNLYSELIGEFLHLGYFDNPNILPEDISLGSMQAAQRRYCEHVLEHISNRDLPILDVGCGMGGMLKILSQQGFSPMGLTPDENQARHLKKSSFPVLHTRFEDLTDCDNRWGTILTLESLQYLDRNRVFSKVKECLAPGGRWILCDYLDKDEENLHTERPSWPFILNSLQQSGFQILHHEDITEHILPTLRFLYFLGERFLLPIFDYLTLKLEHREPGLSYLIEDVISEFRDVIKGNLSVTDPIQFPLKKSYRLVVVTAS